MTIEYLSQRLTADNQLCQSLDYTWYLIKCIDPDSTRLNEGWFKGPFSILNYARHHYRPPSHQQIEWTFPIDYKKLHFHEPMPETKALMELIETIKPDFMFSLHNSGFGGVYFYITEPAPALYEPFHKLVESQELPLHLGETETPYTKEYAKAIFGMTNISDEYDYLEQNGENNPAEIIISGTDSFDYARRFCNSFGLVCELPYFYNPMIHNASPSDMLRRDAVLSEVTQARADFSYLREQYDSVKVSLNVTSPFRDTIEETLRHINHHLDARENWAKTDTQTARMATEAEKFDSLMLEKFYRVFSFGMFVRMLEAEIATTGKTGTLSTVYERVKADFEERVSDLEANLDYTVIPIQKLVRVQLGSALLAATYAAQR